MEGLFDLRDPCLCASQYCALLSLLSLVQIQQIVSSQVVLSIVPAELGCNGGPLESGEAAIGSVGISSTVSSLPDTIKDKCSARWPN